ncbi:hypothetical protein N658DRAFT_503627 [Parathielavia hyrcaniae]|uniref:Uncharacterized protein n=1 Tax=Parathielavia hyrcaniae TaxID=113614 RepID=A0AAN6T653_9PEZI|nr:hypothetical protein N658DRAFT_503627 [Parathielavia hyrcaniae]
MAPTTPPPGQTAEPRSNGSDEKSSSEEPPAPLPSSSSVGDHLAQALRDLARGEQTASTLEANLSNLESKLDEILASLGPSSQDADGPDEENGQQQQQKKKKNPDGDEKDAAKGETGNRSS